MKFLDQTKVREVAVELVQRSCTTISPDVMELLERAAEVETSHNARRVILTMLDNVRLAEKARKPVCQSPGFPTVYVGFGDGFSLRGLKESLTKAIIDCTEQGYLRPSMVHPLTRQNSGNNSGDGVPNIELEYHAERKYIEVIISFKGCGAELGNVMKVMTPASLGRGYSGLKRLVLETVIEAGGKPCPPFGVGIGIGGQMDVACKLSRRAISVRDWRDTHPDLMLGELEQELLENINKMGLGAAGIGGGTACLAVKIGLAYTHTAICPVAINFHCWVARRSGVRIFEDGSVEWLFGRGT